MRQFGSNLYTNLSQLTDAPHPSPLLTGERDGVREVKVKANEVKVLVIRKLDIIWISGFDYWKLG